MLVILIVLGCIASAALGAAVMLVAGVPRIVARMSDDELRAFTRRIAAARPMSDPRLTRTS